MDVGPLSDDCCPECGSGGTQGDYGPYRVNIAKPPIGPPSITMRCGLLGGERETKESIQLRADYKAYTKALSIVRREHTRLLELGKDSE